MAKGKNKGASRSDRFPQSIKDSVNIEKEHFRWDIKDISFDFPEDVREDLTAELLVSEIIPKLQEHEDKKWGTMETHPNHHFVDLEQSRNPAPLEWLKTREAKEKLDCYGVNEEISREIFSFRINNKRRLYGFRDGAIFRILFYDHNHLLYPAKPRRT